MTIHRGAETRMVWYAISRITTILVANTCHPFSCPSPKARYKTSSQIATQGRQLQRADSRRRLAGRASQQWLRRQILASWRSEQRTILSSSQGLAACLPARDEKFARERRSEPQTRPRAAASSSFRFARGGSPGAESRHAFRCPTSSPQNVSWTYAFWTGSAAVSGTPFWSTCAEPPEDDPHGQFRPERC